MKADEIVPSNEDDGKEDVCKYLDGERNKAAAEGKRPPRLKIKREWKWKIGQSPVQSIDVEKCHIVTEGELFDVLNARFHCLLAQQHYKMKLSTLRLKLLQLATVRAGMSVKLTVEPDGTMKFIDYSSSPPEETTILPSE